MSGLVIGVIAAGVVGELFTLTLIGYLWIRRRQGTLQDFYNYPHSISSEVDVSCSKAVPTWQLFEKEACK